MRFANGYPPRPLWRAPLQGGELTGNEVQVQFQLDEVLYEWMNAEIGIFVYRNRGRLDNWA